MKEERVTYFECGSCGHEYESEEDAEECCPNYAYEIDKWKCGVCEKVYYDKDEARECCK